MFRILWLWQWTEGAGGATGGGITAGQIQDIAYQNLGALGYTQGDLTARLIAYYKAHGATSNCLNDAEGEFLRASGATPGQLQDMWYDYLTRVKGYTHKDIAALMKHFWAYGA